MINWIGEGGNEFIHATKIASQRSQHGLMFQHSKKPTAWWCQRNFYERQLAFLHLHTKLPLAQPFHQVVSCHDDLFRLGTAKPPMARKCVHKYWIGYCFGKFFVNQETPALNSFPLTFCVHARCQYIHGQCAENDSQSAYNLKCRLANSIEQMLVVHWRGTVQYKIAKIRKPFHQGRHRARAPQSNPQSGQRRLCSSMRATILFLPTLQARVATAATPWTSAPHLRALYPPRTAQC